MAFFRQSTFYNHTSQGSLKECMPAEPLALKKYLFKGTSNLAQPGPSVVAPLPQQLTAEEGSVLVGKHTSFARI